MLFFFASISLPISPSSSTVVTCFKKQLKSSATCRAFASAVTVGGCPGLLPPTFRWWSYFSSGSNLKLIKQSHPNKTPPPFASPGLPMVVVADAPGDQRSHPVKIITFHTLLGGQTKRHIFFFTIYWVSVVVLVCSYEAINHIWAHLVPPRPQLCAGVHRMASLRLGESNLKASPKRCGCRTLQLSADAPTTTTQSLDTHSNTHTYQHKKGTDRKTRFTHRQYRK